MNNVTTPETAQRLKSAGFPQPEPKPGQYWCKIPGHWDFYGLISRPHKRHKGDFWAVFLPVNLSVLHPDHEAQIESSLFDGEGLIYAPTATDILRELGKDAQFGFTEIGWICAYKNEYYTHTNPAEAAALAWLDKHEKQNG